MHGASFFDSLVTSVAAHTELSVLQDLIAEMRGNHLSPAAIAFVEQKVSAALDQVESADAAFPYAVDEALWARQHPRAKKVAPGSAH